MISKYQTLILTLFCLFSFNGSQLSAQPLNNIVKNVVLPTPSATAFGKFGEIPVSYSTGLVNTSVPIWEIKNGPLTHAIALTYHSAGVKVGELASWVGLNWNLTAGGVVSRTVLNIPDESANGYYFQGTQINSGLNPSTYASILNGTLDGEPDLLSFTAGSYSGKFFVDQNHVIRQFPVQDVAIEMIEVFKGFIVTTPDGVRYIFGKIPGTSTTAYDQVRTTNESASNITAFHLLKIESYDKKYSITFNYISEYYAYKTLASCKYQITSNCGNGGPPVTCSSTTSYDVNHPYVTSVVDGKQLSSITYPGYTINFVATGIREDLDVNTGTTGNRARRLDQIEINSGAFCKRFQLNYNYFEDNTYAGTRSEAKRLKLESVVESSCNSTIVLPGYIFEYEGPIVAGKQWLPHRLHKGIDHWGFYNGQNANENIQVIVPTNTPLDVNGNIVTYGTALRESNLTYMKYGALKKITYPTGGSTAFTYGANTIYTQVPGTPTSIFNVQTCTSPIDQACCDNKTNSAFRTQNQNELASTYKLHLVRTDNSTTTCSASSYVSVLLKVYNGATQVGARAFNLSAGQSSEIMTGTLASLGVTSTTVNYKFEISSVDGYGKFEIIYTPLSYDNKVIGGLRILEVRSSDGITPSNNDLVRTYDYSEETAPTQSGAAPF